jgi:enoyl-CoA hydratase/carnithine racemase
MCVSVTRSAFFGLPEGQRGIFVGGGGTVRIQRVVGTTVMMDMMLTGRLLNPAEGLQEHVVRYVTPAGQALAKAQELAERIAQNSVETNWMIVNVLPRVQDLSHDDGLFMEQLNFATASARPRPRRACASSSRARRSPWSARTEAASRRALSFRLT